MGIDLTKANNRLTLIITELLSDNNKDGDSNPTLNLTGLSESTGIPAGILSEDIINILLHEYFRECVIIYDPANKVNVTTLDFLRRLRSKDSSALELCVGLDDDIFKGELWGEGIFLPLDTFEKNIFFESEKLPGVSGAVRVKRSAFGGSAREIKNAEAIRRAISGGHPVSFTYRHYNTEETYDCFNASLIFKEPGESRLFCVAFSQDNRPVFVRLAFIKNLKVLTNKKLPPVPEGATDIFDHLWGAENDAFEVYHVKLRISNDTTNIIEKITTETNTRKYRRLYPADETGDIWIYEDDVCGLASFKKWVLRYGASVIALEPKELVDDIKETLQKKLKAYEG